MQQPLRVLHLAGSAISDFYADLSSLYARDCLAATAAPEYEFHVAYVTPDKQWRFPDDLSRACIAAAAPMSVDAAIRHLRDLNLDVVVPQMFCVPGMTTYRALFDLLGIPYVGNPPDVMALGADKVKAKAVVAVSGVHVPQGELLSPGEPPTLTPPVVVKPADTDNSLGLSLVRQSGGYDAALETAFSHSERVLVEDYIELGREVRCGVIVRDGELVCLPLEEYNVSADKPIRNYDDKISGEGNDLDLVAKNDALAWLVDPSDPVTQQVWDAAKRCHVALGCRHYSLFDFRVDADGQPWFLEAGLYCSFARKSVVSMMARAAGIELKELFGMMVEQSVATH